MSNLDYGELFCQAVDQIVEKRLEAVSYDSTILCTIVDDSNRSKGLYIVTNNNTTKFEAFSENTTYRKNNNVYVQIPGGDWNQQKIIVSKKTDTNKEAYTYKKPFDSFVDITGNLINGTLNSTGLVANDFTPNFTDKYKDSRQSITLWTYNLNDKIGLVNNSGSAYSAFTRLGIQASFKAQLNPFYEILTSEEKEGKTEDEIEELESMAHYVVNGDYGLRLRIYTVKQVTGSETENTNISSEESDGAIYDLYLNCDDMNGNPYDFQTFFNQEKVFDLSVLGDIKIQAMQLQFYQTEGTFIDREGNKINHKGFLNSVIKENLFVNDLFISLGYDMSEFDKEMVQIYTLDPVKYISTANPLSKNNKQIFLRWIHKQDDGIFKSISLADEDLEYEVRWYRYELGHSSADKYSGVYWKRLSTQVVSKNGSYAVQIDDEDWNTYNLTNSPPLNPGFFSTWIIPDTTLQTEQVKAVVIYKNQPYFSNVLTFDNDKTVVNKPTVDAVQALNVVCTDNTYGNYRIYNHGNMLIDSAQKNIIRNFITYFKTSIGNQQTEPEELKEAESIEWIIPTKKTMIVLDGFKSKKEIDKVQKNGENIYDNSNSVVGRYYYEDNDDERIHIIRYGSGIKGTDISKYNYQPYRIKNYYSQTDSDNTIQCKVIKEKITYTTTKELTFGVAGTTGTDYTFIIDFDDNVTAVTADPNGRAVTVTARLYDYENKEVNIKGYNIEWDWKTSDGLLSINALNNSESLTISREIKYIPNSAQPLTYSYNILQAKLVWGDFDLIAYLPIPLRKSEDYAYISGTTQIIYNSAGEILEYFKNPYIMYNNNAEQIEGCFWECGNASTKIWTNNTIISNLKNLITGTVGDLVDNPGDLKLISTIAEINWKQEKEDIENIANKDLLYDAFSIVDKKIIDNASNNYFYFIGQIAKLHNTEKTPYIKRSDLLALERKGIYVFQYYQKQEGQKDTGKVDEDNNPIMENFYDFKDDENKKLFFKAIGHKFFDDCCFTDPYVPYISIYEEGTTLTPLSFYVADSCNEVSVICSINEKINNTYTNTVVWSQPILVMQNRYPSAMINKWDGSLDVGKTDAGTILAPRLVAGKKDINNTFTGIVMGAWEGTNSSSDLTSGTGLFGYYQGEQSYGFKDDGTAFIGKSGAGRISFKGKEGIIQSASYDNGQGMQLNLSSGLINAHQFKLTAGSEDKNIIIDSTADRTADSTGSPLQIGSKFSVKWDGTLSTSSGVFDQGAFNDITVTNGTFDGELNVTGAFYGATIYGGYIGIGGTKNDKFIVTGDGDVTCNNLTVNGGIINASGEGLGGITVNGGFNMANGGILGNISSNIGGVDQQYPGIGISCGSGVVKATEGNAGMAYSSAYVSCSGAGVVASSTKINGDFEVTGNTKGVYATLA